MGDASVDRRTKVTDVTGVSGAAINLQGIWDIGRGLLRHPTRTITASITTTTATAIATSTTSTR